MDDLLIAISDIAQTRNPYEYGLPTHDEELLALMCEQIKQFVSKKCAEQRQLCVDNAKINVEAKFKGEVRNTQANSYFYDFKEQGGKREITVYIESIINAPEPIL